MKLERLVKQLRRDATANPKKTAILGVMVLVAIYFWAPLVWQWIGPSADRSPPEAANLILTDDPVDPAQRQSREQIAYRWDRVRERMAEDRLMQSAVFDPAWNDPFALSITDAAATATRLASQPPTEIDPKSLGLALTSVVVGSKRRTATINGRLLEEGDRVTTPGGDTLLPPWQVARIRPDSVELECNGRIYRLELERSQLAGGDQIKPLRPGSAD